MITKELFSFYSVDQQTSMINLGTKKHPIGTIKVNVHLDYEVPDSIYISVHGCKWYVSFSNENDVVVATEGELLADLQHLTEEQLMEVTNGFDRNVVAPVASSDGNTFDYNKKYAKHKRQKMYKNDPMVSIGYMIGFKIRGIRIIVLIGRILDFC